MIEVPPPLSYNEPGIDAGYIGCVLHPTTFKERFAVVVEAVKRMQRHRPVDTVVFTGNSGAIMAPAVAAYLELHMVMVRKTADASHSFREVEGSIKGKNFVIIDDLVSSGRTIRRVLDTIHSWSASYRPHIGEMQCVGVIEYASERGGSGSTRFDLDKNHVIDVFNAYHLIDPLNLDVVDMLKKPYILPEFKP